MAGAIFGKIGVLFFVAGAAFHAILGDSRNTKYCIFFNTICWTNWKKNRRMNIIEHCNLGYEHIIFEIF